MFICLQKIKSLLFWDIASILQTCHFGWFDYVWLWPVKAILPASSKLWCLSLGKKSCLSLPSFRFPLFLKYYKNIRNLLFCVFWACPSKAIVPTCKKLWRLSSKKKKKSTRYLNFLEILHFKEYWNLIGQKHFGKWVQNKKFAR